MHYYFLIKTSVITVPANSKNNNSSVIQNQNANIVQCLYFISIIITTYDYLGALDNVITQVYEGY
jgi:hypothetical protein